MDRLQRAKTKEKRKKSKRLKGNSLSSQNKVRTEKGGGGRTLEIWAGGRNHLTCLGHRGAFNILSWKAGWVARLVCRWASTPKVTDSTSSQVGGFSSCRKSTERPYRMIIRHVKDPLSVCVAWVLSAKLNPSADYRTSSRRQVTGCSKATTNQDDHYLILVARCYRGMTATNSQMSGTSGCSVSRHTAYRRKALFLLRGIKDEILKLCERFIKGAVSAEIELVDKYLDKVYLEDGMNTAISPDLSPIDYVWDDRGKTTAVSQCPPKTIPGIIETLVKK
ncbi:hypothetical protein TNCV_4666931 [Trichonephila clavipes]|nr:hypothetical protein TNCV_4666931 [Trichonephila clavipes]